MNLLLSFLISSTICIILIPILMRSASCLGMVDAPNDRKVHMQSIPRCGGLGIAAGTMLAFPLFVSLSADYYALMAGGLVLIIFGVLDDIADINYKWKFIGQILAVSIVMSQGVLFTIVPFFGPDPAPFFVSYPLTLLFVVGVINAVNLSDGLDGLAAGMMLMSLAYIALFSLHDGGMNVAVISMALMGSIIGFLRFNTFPAVVFMGDTGSQFIGFMAAFLAIMMAQTGTPAINPALPLFILGIPVLDTISVVVQRIRAGKSPFSPDKRHIHHKLLVYGFSHEEAVIAIYLMQAFFLATGYYLKYDSDLVVFGAYFFLCNLVLGFFYWAGHTSWQLHSENKNADRRKNRFRKYNSLFIFTRKYIEISLIFLLSIVTVALIYLANFRLSFEAVFLCIAYLTEKWLPIRFQNYFLRTSIYSSVIIASFLLTPYQKDLFQIIIAADVFFVILFLVVLLAVSITRKVYFRLTTQDLLAAILLLAAVFFGGGENFWRLISYLFCLGYALEYLFHRNFYMFKMLRIMGMMFFLNIGYITLDFLVRINQ